MFHDGDAEIFMKDFVLCSISTRDRYNTTLPLAMQAIAMQTVPPDKLIIYDDSAYPVMLNQTPLYQYLFQLLAAKGIDNYVEFGEKKGQHYNHQRANTSGYKWVWRVDDDEIPEPDVLEKLLRHTKEQVGAVGGLVLTPGTYFKEGSAKLSDINNKPHVQMCVDSVPTDCEHLHSTFLYRAGVEDYNLHLSKVAHREETIFTHGLYKKGYKLIFTPHCKTWHLRNPEGGIRAETDPNLWAMDEAVFKSFLNTSVDNNKYIVLDNGIGDHIMFLKILPEILEANKNKEIIIANCYPELFEPYKDRVKMWSIAQAKQRFGNLDKFNIYRFCADKNWQDELWMAFREMYL